MSEDKIINPFKQIKKTDWTQKTKERLEIKSKLGIENNENTKTQIASKPDKLKTEKSKIIRVAKSFKVYPGKIIKDFDKRVNKMQVKFDDMDFEKDYVDSGKYIMFLMSLSEELNLHELYKPVELDGKISIDKNKLKKLMD